MNFVNSFLLWSAAGAALPVLIHMLNREKPKKVYIPTVEFIIKAVQKSSGSRKLNNFLLLLMRMLILACISMIIARPQIEKFLTADSNKNLQVVIIVDNSYYTVHTSTNVQLIDEIKSHAKEIVDSLPVGTMISIMTAEESENEFTEIKEYANDRIDQLSPAPVKTDMHSLISSADDMLKDLDNKAEKRIYVISDMNYGAWESNFQIAGINKDELVLVPLKPRVGNVFISHVDIKSTGFTNSQKIFERRETEILVNISGDRELAGMKVKLLINDQEVDEKVIFSSDRETALTFHTSFDKSGLYFCEAKIETQDSIQTDNTFFFNINVLEPVKAFIVNDIKSLNPLIYRAALSPSGWHGKQKFDIELLSYSRVQNRLQEETPGLIILSGSLAFDNMQWQAIKNYIDQGGNVLICPDKTTQFTVINQLAYPLINSKIIPIDGELKLNSSANEDWKSPLDISDLYEFDISHGFTFEKEPQGENVVIPVRFNNGQVAFSVHQINQGTISFWGVSPDSEFSDFLSNDSFPLFWHTVVEKLTDTDSLNRNLICGFPADVFANLSEIKNYFVQSPAGNKDNIPADSFMKFKGDYMQGQFDQTFIPGHYYTNSKVFRGFSCNLERSADYFKFPSEKEYQHLMEKKVSDTGKQVIYSTFGPDGLLVILIIATLIFMVIEIHLGNKNYYADN